MLRWSLVWFMIVSLPLGRMCSPPLMRLPFKRFFRISVSVGLSGSGQFDSSSPPSCPTPRARPAVDDTFLANPHSPACRQSTASTVTQAEQAMPGSTRGPGPIPAPDCAETMRCRHRLPVISSKRRSSKRASHLLNDICTTDAHTHFRSQALCLSSAYGTRRGP